MKRSETTSPDLGELRRGDDRTTLIGGVRGKYFKRYSRGTNLIRLDPDVSKAFPDDKSVNDALRLLVSAAKKAVGARSA